MKRVNIKAMSVNDAWKGRRFPTDLYEVFREKVSLLLRKKDTPKVDTGKGWLFAHYRWGISTMGKSDTDNPCKQFQDVLFDRYGLKDVRVRFLILEKVKAEKGEEFIDWEVQDEACLIEYLEDLLEHLKSCEASEKQ